MQMAYSEADIQGVVSLHGDFSQPSEKRPDIKPRILVAPGGADPFYGRARHDVSDGAR
jgi:hypothetical protein